jgi:hypothetical protein
MPSLAVARDGSFQRRSTWGADSVGSDLYILVAMKTAVYDACMTSSSYRWLLLVISIPTSGATARMRIWRALRQIGCAALRDGAYLLPSTAPRAMDLSLLAEEARTHEGQAWILDVQPHDSNDEAAYQALFDRASEYEELNQALGDARQTLSDLGEAELTRLMRRHEKLYEAVRMIDFFPNNASLRAQTQWKDFAETIETILSPGEPHAATGAIARRDSTQYQGRLWATRAHLWVDRVACAWLIRRFIDPHARFLWLDKIAHCPKDALGFDFDGATFTHVGERVSFEVLLASFGLDEDRALRRLGGLVHALDVGGGAHPEAAGFEAILAGSRARLGGDDALLDEMGLVLDSLYTHFAAQRRG